MRLIADHEGVDLTVRTRERLVVQTPTVAVAAGEPDVSLRLDDGSQVLVWGDLYYLSTDDAVVAWTGSGEAAGLLRALWSREPLDEVVARLEGRFVGLAAGPNAIVVFGDALSRVNLYHAARNGRLVVSTELRDAIELVSPVRYDQNGLACLLSVFGYYAPKRHTIYAGVNRLGVGERLVVANDGWRVESTPFRPRSIGAGEPRELDEYADRFLAAVDTRATDDNWVFLSSGWDSTAVLAALVHLRGAARVRAVIGRMDYSTRVDGINRFEIDRAGRVAEHFGVPLDVVSLNLREPEAQDVWEQVREPFRDHHLYAIAGFNQVKLARFIEADGRGYAVFTGEHSDGLHNFGFSQYATVFHRDLAFREYADKMMCYLFGPTFFRAVAEGRHEEDEVFRFMRMLAPSTRFRDGGSSALDRRRGHLLPFFVGGRRLPFAEPFDSALLTAEGSRGFEAFVLDEYLGEAFDAMTPETLYAWLLRLYPSFHWQGSTATMGAVALELSGQSVRMPFHDGRLVDFCSAMPESWGRGLNLNPTKYPLKWTLANRVPYPTHLQVGPHSYLYDVDPTFSHSAEILYASAMTERFKEALGGRAYRDILDGRLFDLPYLDSLVEDFRAGREVRGRGLNDLFSLTSLCLIGWY